MPIKPVKIGIALADLESMPTWVLRLINKVQTSELLQMCAVIGPVPPRQKVKANWLFRTCIRLERTLAAKRQRPTGEEIDHVTTGLEFVGPADTDALKALELDVILDLSGNHGNSLPPSAARHGIWFSDATTTVAGAAGMQALLEHSPVNHLGLYRRTIGQPMVQAIASGSLNPKFIAARNEWFLEEKSVALFVRELMRLARDGIVGTPQKTPLFFAPPVPSLSETIAYIVGMLSEAAGRTIAHLGSLAGMRPGMFMLKSARGDIVRFDQTQAKEITPGRNQFHADPFLWKVDDTLWCFFEAFDYSTGKGRISAGRLIGSELTDIRTVLETDYHLSFPFLFEHDGALFMMPESCANRRIEIWKCTEFPGSWELHSTALENALVADSQVVQMDDQWWLFTSMCDDPFGDLSSELHIYRASSPLLEELEAHPLNPVVFDSRHARNAGRIQRRNGKFLRPAQDNSHSTYGFGLHLMQIDSLSFEDYREHSIRHTAPNFEPGLIGCHHIDYIDEHIVFDVRRQFGGRG